MGQSRQIDAPRGARHVRFSSIAPKFVPHGETSLSVDIVVKVQNCSVIIFPP
jgi:hypothetical protein